MTTADVLHRSRWWLLLLPTAVAAVFRMLPALSDVNLFTFGAFNVSVGWLLDRSAFSAEFAWVALTLTCSILIAYNTIGAKRDADSASFYIILVPVIFGVHMWIVIRLLRFFPL